MRRFKTHTLVAGLAAAAVAAPSASAAPVEQVLPSAPDASGSSAAAQSPTVEVDSTGFDWGDAGIGAAGTVSLLALGAGSVVVARRSRRAPAAS